VSKWEALRQAVEEGLKSCYRDPDPYRAQRRIWVYRKVLDHMSKLESAPEPERWQKVCNFLMFEGQEDPYIDPHADIVSLPTDSEGWLEISFLMSKVERDDSD
jgi:hypothetical protein